MPLWSEIVNPLGIYESEIFNISNSLSRYITLIDIVYTNPNNKRMDFYYSISYDNSTWTEWKQFYQQSFDMLDEYDISSLYFKYRVIFETDDINDKPYLQSISFTLTQLEMIENISDLPFKPKLWIRKVNVDGDIKLINHYTNQSLEFIGLQNGEEIFVDCENEDIISSWQNVGVYRYDNHNNEWLEFIIGKNYLRAIGDFDLDVRYQGKLLQE